MFRERLPSGLLTNPGATAILVMQIPLEHRFRSGYSVFAVGALSLAMMILFQAFGLESIASANSRDEFPGRRQGGGTHWVSPIGEAE